MLGTKRFIAAVKVTCNMIFIAIVQSITINNFVFLLHCLKSVTVHIYLYNTDIMRANVKDSRLFSSDILNTSNIFENSLLFFKIGTCIEVVFVTFKVTFLFINVSNLSRYFLYNIALYMLR